MEQAAEKYDKDFDLIVQQIDPLVELLSCLQGINYTEFEKLEPYKKIREIGETINKIGGHSAMLIPFYDIKSKNRTLASILDSCWHLIGTWMR